MPEDSPTSTGWKQLFQALHIRQHLEAKGIYRLSAKQIHRVAKREPRLMTKFDRRDQRPKILADLGVTILPVTNGEYVLLRGDGYFELPPPGRVQTYDASGLAGIRTIPWREGVHSEPQATDALFVASAIRSFAGDDTLLLTIRGKLRSQPFSFQFPTTKRIERLQVDGVQIEIDSGFEGRVILLLEAKFGEIGDFIVRQLYYPYRHLLAAGTTKEILPVLLVYSNKVYSLYQFSFAARESYQSIQLVRQASYSLEQIRPLPRFR